MRRSRSSPLAEGAGGWTRSASAPRSAALPGHRPDGVEDLGGARGGRHGRRPPRPGSAGGERRRQADSTRVAIVIAQAKSRARMGPDRHSADRLAGHPRRVTLQRRSRASARPRRTAPAPPGSTGPSSGHRDRHEYLASPQPTPRPRRPSTASPAHQPALRGSLLFRLRHRRATPVIPRSLDPAAEAVHAPFDFSIPEARLLLTQFPRVAPPRNSPRLPHSTHTSHEFFQLGA